MKSFLILVLMLPVVSIAQPMLITELSSEVTNDVFIVRFVFVADYESKDLEARVYRPENLAVIRKAVYKAGVHSLKDPNNFFDQQKIANACRDLYVGTSQSEIEELKEGWLIADSLRVVKAQEDSIKAANESQLLEQEALEQEVHDEGY